MEQLSIFSDGGETKKEVVGLNTYNSDDLVKKHLENKVIYQATDVDDNLISMVDSDDFFKDDLDSDEFYVCVDYLKNNKKEIIFPNK